MAKNKVCWRKVEEIQQLFEASLKINRKPKTIKCSNIYIDVNKTNPYTFFDTYCIEYNENVLICIKLSFFFVIKKCRQSVLCWQNCPDSLRDLQHFLLLCLNWKRIELCSIKINLDINFNFKSPENSQIAFFIREIFRNKWILLWKHFMYLI